MNKGSELQRIGRIGVRYARRFGVSAAVYASHVSLDLMLERWRKVDDERVYDGLTWARLKTRDVYKSPRDAAMSLRRQIRELWA